MTNLTSDDITFYLDAIQENLVYSRAAHIAFLREDTTDLKYIVDQLVNFATELKRLVDRDYFG